MDHLKYAGKTDAVQRLALGSLIRAEPVLMTVLTRLRAVDLPDWLLASGAIYNSVWNQLTGRPSMTGVKDIDVTYFDESDLSYAAEDRVIKQLDKLFGDLPVPVEVRNQARVHLWFPEKFNQPFAPLASSVDMLGFYASKTHAVATRLNDDDTLSLFAPFGLEDMFSFRIAPNHRLDNRATHESKGARAKSVWPELTLVPW